MGCSFYARYRATGDGLLLGGVAASQTSRYARRTDAEQHLASVIELNRGKAECVGEVLESALPPDIFPHCPGSIPQAVGGRCFRCGKTLTEEDAARHLAGLQPGEPA